MAKAKVLVDGKTFREVQQLATEALNHGQHGDWPRIVLKLLKVIYDQAKEAQGLRQIELFTPPPVHAKGAVGE